MAQYAIYLRKSRADVEAEARGEGETLERHRTALRAFAERRGLNVVKEYAELVTGDSIAARPQMQLLMDDVKRGLYDGVIVNDVDRLGRGDSIDQEIIKYTFVAGHCIIITPSRDIDPASPSDEDMLDFSLFFARFEYRKISQRLTQGRTRSAAAGNYLSPRVPLGYKKTIDGKRITLEIDEDTAPIVKMIFDWYASRKYGYKAIASKLNDMGLRSYSGQPFDRTTIRGMLQNPVYTGRIVWGKTATISTIEEGRRKKKTIESTPLITENAHPAIISDETFDKVQRMFDESRHAYPTHTNTVLVNPLAGILFCEKCGKAMQLRGGRRAQGRVITCINTECDNRGTYVRLVLDALLEILQAWCAEYKAPAPIPIPEEDDAQTQAAKRQIEALEAQITRAQELVEMGVYTPSEFIKRRTELQKQLDAAKALIIVRPVPTQSIPLLLPSIRRVIDAFPYAETADEQNRLLKSIVERVEYCKTRVATKSVDPKSLIKLTVFPRIGNII